MQYLINIRYNTDTVVKDNKTHYFKTPSMFYIVKVENGLCYLPKEQTVLEEDVRKMAQTNKTSFVATLELILNKVGLNQEAVIERVGYTRSSNPCASIAVNDVTKKLTEQKRWTSFLKNQGATKKQILETVSVLNAYYFNNNGQGQDSTVPNPTS